MKKIFYLIFILIFFNSAANAVEEVLLPQPSLNLNTISDIYYGKAEKEEDIPKVLKLFTKNGLEFENSKINSIKMSFLYSGHLFYNNTENTSQYMTHDFNSVEPMISVNFNENRTKAMFDINLTRNIRGYSNWFTQRISQVFISHQLTDNQTLIFGQYGRLPNTIDGSKSILNQEFALKSQLGRNLSDVRAMGIRNRASYKYLDYDIGLYDSTRYMKDFGNGLDFTGYVTLKPFANCSEAINSFKLGSGYNIGHNNISYNMYSVFASYDYKKFHTQMEYANADGYNAVYESHNKAEGFYTLVSYDVTPKLSLLVRYDIYDGNKHFKNDTSTEYTAGITYKIFKNLKVMLNYVRKNSQNQPDSNMILFATRFII